MVLYKKRFHKSDANHPICIFFVQFLEYEIKYFQLKDIYCKKYNENVSLLLFSHKHQEKIIEIEISSRAVSP